MLSDCPKLSHFYACYHSIVKFSFCLFIVCLVMAPSRQSYLSHQFKEWHSKWKTGFIVYFLKKASLFLWNLHCIQCFSPWKVLCSATPGQNWVSSKHRFVQMSGWINAKRLHDFCVMQACVCVCVCAHKLSWGWLRGFLRRSGSAAVLWSPLAVEEQQCN